MQEVEPDECQMQIEFGGETYMAIASDETEMCHQLLTAIAISTLLAGGLVHLEGWLPGMILKVQAIRSVENGDQLSIAHVWPSIYARMRAWIDSPADADALDLSFDGAHCVLVPDVFTWHIEPVAFTLRCLAGVPCSV